MNGRKQKKLCERLDDYRTSLSLCVFVGLLYYKDDDNNNNMRGYTQKALARHSPQLDEMNAIVSMECVLVDALNRCGFFLPLY